MHVTRAKQVSPTPLGGEHYCSQGKGRSSETAGDGPTQERFSARSRRGRPVREVHDPTAEGLRVGERQTQLLSVALEQAGAGANYDRELEQAQLVEQAFVQQRADQRRAAADVDVLAVLLLEALKLLTEVPRDQARVLPLGLLQGSRGDELGVLFIASAIPPVWPANDAANVS
jgi:hypothetical protein